MKHLPNLLTLANLFCGCIAIAFIVNAQPYWTSLINGEQYSIYGTEQAYLGSLFIGIAAICDVLDGLAARGLRVFSPIGKDLDSLADVVSFGVAPSMILFKMIWAAYMGQPDALDISMLATAPAFLVACFAALRLARYNITANQQKTHFIGMPVPAVGLFVASFPLINWYNPMNLGYQMQHVWVLYAIVAALCWLMVSRISFFKLLPGRFSMASAWPQLVLVVATVVCAFIFRIAAIPIAFILYIILSLIYKPPVATAPEN